MKNASVTYLYCVIGAARRPSAAGIPQGLPGGSTPEILAVAPRLWLAVSDVPASEYASERVEARLRDLDWVSGIALAHEAIVEHFAQRRATTVIPMKLFTMFSSQARAVAESAARGRDLARAIARVAGCDEWGLRVTRSTGKGSSRESSRRAGASGAVSGTAFLARRKAARDRTRLERREAVTCAEDVFAALASMARDVTRRQDGPEAGSNPPLLEAALLMPRGARGRVEREGRRLASACAGIVDVRLTGPWPPYNFVTTGDGR